MTKMKLSLVMGVTLTVLSELSPLRAAQNDYVATELDDPLQPVWDRLDNMAQDLSDSLLMDIRKRFSALDTTFTREMRSMESTLTSLLNDVHRFQRMQAAFSLDPTDDIKQAVVQAYQDHIKENVDEAVAKIERHVESQVTSLESRVKAYIDSEFSVAPGEAGGEHGPGVGLESRLNQKLNWVTEAVNSSSATLQNINTHVTKLNEKIGESSEGDNTCSTLVDKVSELLDGAGNTCEPVNSVTGTTLRSDFSPRDCSDIHWMQPEAPSGVFYTYPTLDYKAPVTVYCDMGQGGAKETGGWTVILRRHNSTWGLTDFNRTWNEYREGFGQPGEGEWWFGLAYQHALTYRQPFEVSLLMHDIEMGTFEVNYTTFRIEDESQQYKLVVSGFSGNLTHDALASKHHGSAFTTWDRDNDEWASGNCGQINAGGWWFNACHYTTLTATFPTSNDRNARTIRWLEDDWLVLDDVTMKIRPANYAQRFDAFSVQD